MTSSRLEHGSFEEVAEATGITTNWRNRGQAHVFGLKSVEVARSLTEK
jgi:hypothetical protein